MMLTELIYAQAVNLAGAMEEHQDRLLKILCAAAAASLAARLKEGLKPEDCKADFIAAASLMALAALNTAGEKGEITEFQAGELSFKNGREHRDAASRCLETQARMLIGPYLKDSFAFAGV